MRSISGQYAYRRRNRGFCCFWRLQNIFFGYLGHRKIVQLWINSAFSLFGVIGVRCHVEPWAHKWNWMSQSFIESSPSDKWNERFLFLRIVTSLESIPLKSRISRSYQQSSLLYHCFHSFGQYAVQLCSVCVVIFFLVSRFQSIFADKILSRQCDTAENRGVEWRETSRSVSTNDDGDLCIQIMSLQQMDV